MGSKRVMLRNGLGDLLRSDSPTADRVVDLFCGAASVAWFAATELEKPVVAVDLQEYAATLAGAVVRRTRPLSPNRVVADWILPARRACHRMTVWKEARVLDAKAPNTATWRKRSQELCGAGTEAEGFLIWCKYGGHYFSPTQALSFDAMLKVLPASKELRDVCLAATIIAASLCAASPGHTAQPFKATRTAGRYLREAWMRDPFAYARRAVEELCPLHATKPGQARVADANEAAKALSSDDLVFLDPPYSGVHYSRFYHVLETIARGRCGKVDGVGRYPPPQERPNSAYSRKDKSRDAMNDLLKTLADRRCRVVLTFPKDTCSNGLSGDAIEEMAKTYFEVARRSVKTRFSTLGGNTANRAARTTSDELMLALRPRPRGRRRMRSA
jgi:adenine-specific DNA methylase